MSPRIPDGKCPNFTILNSLFTLLVSPLSRPPDDSVSYSLSSPESSSEGHPAGYPAGNLESCLACCSVSYLDCCLEKNPASRSEDCVGRSPADSSSGCPENRRERSPEGDLPSSRTGNLLSNWEGHSPDSLHGCPGSCGRAAELSRRMGPTRTESEPAGLPSADRRARLRASRARAYGL